MKKIDLAYVAGIIDGEDWVTIKEKRVKDKLISRAIKVGVGNTNEWLIKWLQFSFGGSVRIHEGTGNQKRRWDWDISTRQAKYFLELVLPYLRMKRPQAELALKFQNRRKYRGHQPMPESDWALDEADKILMTSYNKRGIE
jgi:hypothetical protein